MFVNKEGVICVFGYVVVYTYKHRSLHTYLFVDSFAYFFVYLPVFYDIATNRRRDARTALCFKVDQKASIAFDETNFMLCS